jgi:UDP-N-acetylmuramoylalanine--D-glutamate ligase
MEPGENLPLKGDHNLLNIIASAAVCHILGIPGSRLEKRLTDFSPLEHRMEYVGQYQGIHFYNDSIATIPEATLAAIAALKEVDTLILGGTDRGIDYTGLTAALPGTTVRNLILVGAAGDRIKALLELSGTEQSVFMAADYTEVVRLAVSKTARGKICLLSPAAASYDWFRNFEERGNVFKRLVRDFPA